MNCNDDYGHENRTLVLKSLANTIRSCMRRPLDFFCRWGGGELVVLLPDTDEAGALEVAEYILDAVRKTPIQINGFPPIYITVSIGIACAHHHQNTAPENNLADRADQAMYKAGGTVEIVFPINHCGPIHRPNYLGTSYPCLTKISFALGDCIN